MAIVLQVPSILDVIGSTLKVAHPDVSGYTRTYTASTFTAAGTSLTVTDNDNFADNDYMILGEVGAEKTEEVDVNGAVTRGTALTITNSTKFDHELDTPVTRIFERQVRVYGNNTAANSGGTLIDTIDITWSKPYTEYTVTGTTYNNYYCTFYDGTTEGSAGDYIAAGGAAASSVWKSIEKALEMTGAKIGPQHQMSLEYLVRAADECQSEITQYVHPTTLVKKDWPFESVLDTGLETIQGENRYALSGLTNTPKYQDTSQAIQNVYIGRKGPMRYISVDEFDNIMAGKKRTQLNGASVAGATSITVDDTSEFASSGSLTHGSETLTYTGKTDTSFTGIPATGTGSIGTAGSDNLAIWQGVSNALPAFYTIYDGSLYFNAPVDSTHDDYRIRIRMLKELTALAAASDETDVTFHNVFPFYIAYKIELRRKNFEAASIFKGQFDERMIKNANASNSETLDIHQYFDFEDHNPQGDDLWAQYPNQENTGAVT